MLKLTAYISFENKSKKPASELTNIQKNLLEEIIKDSKLHLLNSPTHFKLLFKCDILLFRHDSILFGGLRRSQVEIGR